MSDQLHQQDKRGLEAEQVLDNPAYQAAMALLKEEVAKQWKACPIRDREGQLLLLQLAKLTDKFEGILTGMVETGKFAHRKLIDDQLRNENVARRALRRIL